MDASGIIPIAQLVLLLLAANGAPIMARKLLGDGFAYPCGQHFRDGRRLLGRSKTWRGVIAALIVTALIAALIGLPVAMGFYFGFLTMAGDVLASFCKRRLAYPESSHAPGLDTLPESLLPLLVLQQALNLSSQDIAIAAAAMGLTLYLLLLAGPVWPFRIAAVICLLAAGEEIALTWLLSEPQSNVRSIGCVLNARMRRR